MTEQELIAQCREIIEQHAPEQMAKLLIQAGLKVDPEPQASLTRGQQIAMLCVGFTPNALTPEDSIIWFTVGGNRVIFISGSVKTAMLAGKFQELLAELLDSEIAKAKQGIVDILRDNNMSYVARIDAVLNEK